MKLNRLTWLKQHDHELIATFGSARLVKNRNGRIELLGGTQDDHTAAKEWISLFMHEAVIHSRPICDSASGSQRTRRFAF